MVFQLEAIATVTCPRSEPIDDDWGAIESLITLDDRFEPSSLKGLEAFSHIEVLYVFHLVDPASVQTEARRPRHNPDWPEVGIFAQRAKGRPNRLGSSCCELLAIEGRRLRVRGLDAIDGTPVLDIKPYMTEFAPRGRVHQPDWSVELMRGYW